MGTIAAATIIVLIAIVAANVWLLDRIQRRHTDTLSSLLDRASAERDLYLSRFEKMAEVIARQSGQPLIFSPPKPRSTERWWEPGDEGRSVPEKERMIAEKAQEN